jgi:hypothetical protein
VSVRPYRGSFEPVGVAILQRANRFHINDKWPAIGADQVVGHTANPFPRNHPPQLKGLADYLSRRWIEVGTWSVNIRTAQFAHDVFGGVPLPTSHTSHRPFEPGVGPQDSKTGLDLFSGSTPHRHSRHFSVAARSSPFNHSHGNVQLDMHWTFHLRIGHRV